MSSAPVWSGEHARAPLRRPPRRAEAVVVGGGITGVSLLAELCEAGVDAILLERDRVGAAASGRNAGFLLAGVAENYARAVARYGRGVAREVWAFTVENHTRTAELAAAVGAPYARRGSRTIGLDAEEAESLTAAAALLGEDGFTVTLEEPTGVPSARCTLFNPGDGEIDPVALVRGVAARHADRIIEDVAVEAIEDGGTSATVHAAGATVEAGLVVVATNAWTAQLVPEVAIRPVRAQMLATAPCARRLGPPVYAEWGHRYWRQLDSGAVLVGGFRNRAVDEEVGFDATPTELVQGHLDAQLHELGVTAPVTHRWAGIMGFSADGLPLAGRAAGRRRIHVCGGYSGHGMGFAVLAAATLARHACEGAGLPAWLDARRGEPGPAG